jgi:hypothetical protein
MKIATFVFSAAFCLAAFPAFAGATAVPMTTRERGESRTTRRCD